MPNEVPPNILPKEVAAVYSKKNAAARLIIFLKMLLPDK